jgi:hypothetical protein
MPFLQTIRELTQLVLPPGICSAVKAALELEESLTKNQATPADYLNCRKQQLRMSGFE